MMINGPNHSTDFSEKTQKLCHDYLHALEEERRKVQVFQRELPLCLELVSQAIETCKQQLSGTTTDSNLHGQSECNSEQTSSHVPVNLEEFFPLKRASSHSDIGEEQESKKTKNNNNDDEISNKDGKNSKDKNSKKSDWLRSVQLWNQTPDPPSKQDSPARKIAVVEVKKNGAFHPFKKEKTVTDATAPTKGGSVPPPSTSSTETGGGNKKEEKEGQSLRKSRRCWSPELHRRFLEALQQLGGSHAATPKQIRELMKVDGLTNDEVKSHLQKYRLHTRRPSPSTHNNNNIQTPQFVVVGGIWVPPEYTAVATTTEASGGAASKAGIYAPVAAPPPPFQESPALKEKHSHSPATSSSTHTTTI